MCEIVSACSWEICSFLFHYQIALINLNLNTFSATLFLLSRSVLVTLRLSFSHFPENILTQSVLTWKFDALILVSSFNLIVTDPMPLLWILSHQVISILTVISREHTSKTRSPNRNTTRGMFAKMSTYGTRVHRAGLGEDFDKRFIIRTVTKDEVLMIMKETANWSWRKTPSVPPPSLPNSGFW